MSEPPAVTSMSRTPEEIGPQIIEGVDIDAVQRAVLSCPGVAGLGSGGPFAMTTYLPGRRVQGIRVSRDLIEVEVRSRWGHSVQQVAQQIRAVLEAIAPGRRVDVTIADIEVPGEQTPPEREIP